MPRRSSQDDPLEIRRRLVSLLAQLDVAFDADNLRNQVRALIPIGFAVRDLGSSLLPADASSARKRILYYLRENIGVPLAGDELRVVAGIDDWARRVRELRVAGWPIVSGLSLYEMSSEESTKILSQLGVSTLDDEEYALLADRPDLLAPLLSASDEGD